MVGSTQKPGPGLIIVEMRISDPGRFKEYTALSAPAVQAAGGRYLVMGGQPIALEGAAAPDRVAVVEFETVEQARTFYHSAAYQAARVKRQGAADFRMLLMEGTGNPSCQ